MTAVVIVLVVIVAGLARYVHVRLYPWKTCPRCAGSRRNTSGTAHRDCGRCGATGRVRRWGAGKEQ